MYQEDDRRTKDMEEEGLLLPDSEEVSGAMRVVLAERDKLKQQTCCMSKIIWLIMALLFTFCIIVAYVNRDKMDGIAVNASAIENGASNNKPFSFLWSKEIWIHVHWSMPMRLRMLYIPDEIYGVSFKGIAVVVTVAIILLWEVFETVAYSVIKQIMWDVGTSSGGTGTGGVGGNNSTMITPPQPLVGQIGMRFAEWFGEAPGDSMIGDVTIGFIGIICATCVKTWIFTGTKNNVHISRRTHTERMLYYVLFVAEALSTILATFMVKLSSPYAVPIFMAPEFSQTPSMTVNFFALGHIFYIIISLSLLECMKNIDLRAACRAGTENDVLGTYNTAILFHIVTWFATYFNLSTGYVWVITSGLSTLSIVLATAADVTRPRNGK